MKYVCEIRQFVLWYVQDNTAKLALAFHIKNFDIYFNVDTNINANNIQCQCKGSAKLHVLSNKKAKSRFKVFRIYLTVIFCNS